MIRPVTSPGELGRAIGSGLVIPRTGRNPERWQQLTSGLDQLPGPLVVIGNWRGDAGVILHINPAWTDLTGYTAAEVLGRPAHSILFADERDAAQFDDVRNVVKDGNPYSGALTCPRKKNDPLDVHIRMWPVRIAKDGEEYLLAAIAGVGDAPHDPGQSAWRRPGRGNILSFGRPNGSESAENQRLAEELVDAQLAFQHQLDSCPFGVERIDTSGRILYANPIYHDFLGYDENELIGENVFERLQDPTHARALESYVRHIVANHPKATPIFTTYRRKDGAPIPLRLDWSHDRSPGGAITGLISVVTPISGLDAGSPAGSEATSNPDQPSPDAPDPTEAAGRPAAGESAQRLLKETLHAARVWLSILSHHHPEGDDAEIVDKADQALDDALRLLGGERRTLSTASSYYEETTPLQGLVIAVVEPVTILRASLSDLLRSWGCHAVAVEQPGETVPALQKSGRLPDMVIVDLDAAIGVSGDSVVRAVWERYGPGVPAALVADDIAPETELFADSVGMKVIRRPVHPIELRSTMLALWRHTRRGRKK